MDDSDARIENLEIKLAFQDDLVAKLDDAVRELGDRIVALTDEVSHLRAELTRLAEEGVDEPTDLLDEKPPHY